MNLMMLAAANDLAVSEIAPVLPVRSLWSVILVEGCLQIENTNRRV